MANKVLSQLHSNRATLQITKFPETTLSISNFRLPGLTMGPALHNTPYRDGPIPGDKIEWEPLDVEFIVNSDLTNWLEMFDWLISQGAPEDRSTQYDYDLRSVDASVILYSAQNIPFATVKFKDCIIVRLGGIDFSEESGETVTSKAGLVLEYSNYEIVKHDI